jgi:hypothetical protein
MRKPNINELDTLNKNLIKYCEFYNLYGEECISQKDSNRFYLFLEFSIPRDTLYIISIKETGFGKYLKSIKCIHPLHVKSFSTENVDSMRVEFYTKAYYLNSDSITQLQNQILQYNIMDLKRDTLLVTELDPIWITLSICTNNKSKNIYLPFGRNNELDKFIKNLLPSTPPWCSQGGVR